MVTTGETETTVACFRCRREAKEQKMKFGTLRDRALSVIKWFDFRKAGWYQNDPSKGRKRLMVAGLVFAVLMILYYPMGMLWFHTISDDIQFGNQTRGTRLDADYSGSYTVEVMAALVNRETNVNRWVSNDPFFLPAALLDNMPNFQQGIIGALAIVSVELRDQLGRRRGASQIDADLQTAASRLQYESDRWIIDWPDAWLPVAPSETQYRSAGDALRSFNSRLVAGDAVFDRRADNLLATLNRIALDLGAASANLQDMVTDDSFALIDTEADDVFFRVKGKLYAYYMVLEALELDFEGEIATNNLAPIWSAMMEALEYAVELDPLLIANGSPDGLIPANHLAAQGFFLLRARTNLREISDILLK